MSGGHGKEGREGAVDLEVKLCDMSANGMILHEHAED